MKLLLDFLPILLFFVAFKTSNIFIATAVLMGATVVQMGIVYAMEKKLQTMQKATLALILVFGALTLLLHDENFIKWKPTVLYVAMAAGMAFSLWGLKKNFLKLMLGSQLDLPDAVWLRLSLVWLGYCLFMALINGYVAAYYSTEQWVNFKLWGYVFPLVFIVGQGLYVSRHLKAEDEKLAAAAEADKAEHPGA